MITATATATEMQNNFGRYLNLVMSGQEISCKIGIAGKRTKCGYDTDYLYKVFGGLNTGIK